MNNRQILRLRSPSLLYKKTNNVFGLSGIDTCILIDVYSFVLTSYAPHYPHNLPRQTALATYQKTNPPSDPISVYPSPILERRLAIRTLREREGGERERERERWSCALETR